MSKLLRRTGEGLLNLKDLLTAFTASSLAAHLGFVRQGKDGEVDLLILQGLLAKLLRRTGRRLAESKGVTNRVYSEQFWRPLRALFGKRKMVRSIC
jgi:hypothetical protein